MARTATVLRLVPQVADGATNSVMRMLAEHAADGDLVAVVMTAKYRDGSEQLFTTGAFHDDTDKAIAASMTAAWNLTQLKSECQS